MRTSMNGKLVMACTCATFVMLLAATQTPARNLSISHTSFHATWASFKLKVAGFTAIACPVTLDGRFHTSTMAKVLRSLVGFVERAAVGVCTTGRATVLTDNLPWHIQYGGFNGTLPTPRPKIRLIGARFRFESIIITCLVTTEANQFFSFILEPTYEPGGNGLVRTITLEPGPRIPCSELGSELEGTGNVVENPGGVQNVLVRLI